MRNDPKLPDNIVFAAFCHDLRKGSVGDIFPDAGKVSNTFVCVFSGRKSLLHLNIFLFVGGKEKKEGGSAVAVWKRKAAASCAADLSGIRDALDACSGVAIALVGNIHRTIYTKGCQTVVNLCVVCFGILWIGADEQICAKVISSFYCKQYMLQGGLAGICSLEENLVSGLSAEIVRSCGQNHGVGKTVALCVGGNNILPVVFDVGKGIDRNNCSPVEAGFDPAVSGIVGKSKTII